MNEAVCRVNEQVWSLNFGAFFFKKNKNMKVLDIVQYTYSDLGVLLASSEGHREPLWVQTPPGDRWDLWQQGWALGYF